MEQVCDGVLDCPAKDDEQQCGKVKIKQFAGNEFLRDVHVSVYYAS